MTRPPVGSTGTLDDLQVEPGDVVECTSGTELWPSISQTITPEGWVLDGPGHRWGPGDADIPIYPCLPCFRLISRANPDQPALQIEAGKYYRTRDGRKVGPMERDEVDGKDWRKKDDSAHLWHDDGSRWLDDFDSDLIAEWQDDQPALQIEAGKYYRTRDGRKVGPMHYSSEPFGEGWSWFDPEGRNWAPHGEFGDTSVSTHENDLIAEWQDDQPAHIITHEGREYDLTALETPFGLLPEPVRDALDAWPHGVEMMTYSGNMVEYNFPDMKGKRGAVWRALTAPVEKRVGVWRGCYEMGDVEYGTCIKRPDGSIDWASWEPNA